MSFDLDLAAQADSSDKARQLLSEKIHSPSFNNASSPICCAVFLVGAVFDMLNNSSFYCLDSKLNSKQSSRNACYAKYKSILSFIQNFQMKIQLTTPEGQSFHLCVTHPQGLANLESESSDFVIKIVPIESVMKIYNQMDVSDPVKVSRLVNELPAGLSQEDIPLLETIGDDNFEIRTVAYVVEALHLLHFTHIPVMVRAQDAHLL